MYNNKAPGGIAPASLNQQSKVLAHSSNTQNSGAHRQSSHSPQKLLNQRQIDAINSQNQS